MTKYRRVRIRGSDVQWPDVCACCCVPQPGEERNLARSEKIYFSLGVRTEWVTCRSTFEVPLCQECKSHILAEETNPLVYGLIAIPGVVVPIAAYQLAGEWLAGVMVRWFGTDQLLADDLSLGFFIVAGIAWMLFLIVSLATWLANRRSRRGGPTSARPAPASWSRCVEANRSRILEVSEPVER